VSALTSTDLLIFVAIGAALGLAYFYSLARTVALLTHAHPSRVVGWYVFRAGAAVSVFWLVARQGALPLLLALGGFLGARLVVQLWIGSSGRWQRVP
jgi:hypothetical protein